MGTQSFVAGIADVTIANGSSTSRVVDGKYEYADATAINIQSPATLPDTVVIEVSYDGSTFATLNDGTSDIAVPGAGKARQYIEMLGTKSFRLKASSNVAADRTFKLSKQFTA